MMLTSADLDALWLSFELAAVTTFILLVISTPLSWWLAFGRSRLRSLTETVATLPMVLPPSVLGFYLLLLLSPDGGLGRVLHTLNLPQLSFSFYGLVLGSVIYSLPFVVQPLKQGFLNIGLRPLEAAETLGAGPFDRFFSIALPLSKHAYLSAAAMGFAHTIGEFGVVLMIGGSIPGETRVASMALYEHVETHNYVQAHSLAACLLIICLSLVCLIYWAQNRARSVHS